MALRWPRESLSSQTEGVCPRLPIQKDRVEALESVFLVSSQELLNHSESRSPKARREQAKWVSVSQIRIVIETVKDPAVCFGCDRFRGERLQD